jgi:hypothetical protein
VSQAQLNLLLSFDYGHVITAAWATGLRYQRRLLAVGVLLRQ